LEIYWEIMERVCSFVGHRLSLSLSLSLSCCCCWDGIRDVREAILLPYISFMSSNPLKSKLTVEPTTTITRIFSHHALIFFSDGSSSCFFGRQFTRLTLPGFVSLNNQRRIVVKNDSYYSDKSKMRALVLFQDRADKAATTLLVFWSVIYDM